MVLIINQIYPSILTKNSFFSEVGFINGWLDFDLFNEGLEIAFDFFANFVGLNRIRSIIIENNFKC